MTGNCSLVYYNGRTVHQFTCWATGYSHGYQLVAQESATRRRRAFYPHRVAFSQFQVTLALKANTQVDSLERPIAMTSEYDQWGKFMADYYNYLLGTGLGTGDALVSKNTMMMVTMKGRGWTQFGIPISGTSFGDHLGSILYSPTLVFETAVDPTNPQASNFSYSTYSDAAAVRNDPAWANAAYPWSEYSQGNKPETLYDLNQELDYRTSTTEVESQVNASYGGGSTNTPASLLITSTQVADISSQATAATDPDASSGTTVSSTS